VILFCVKGRITKSESGTREEDYPKHAVDAEHLGGIVVSTGRSFMPLSKCAWKVILTHCLHIIPEDILCGLREIATKNPFSCTIDKLALTFVRGGG
jgi:hypothetical protein